MFIYQLTVSGMVYLKIWLKKTLWQPSKAPIREQIKKKKCESWLRGFSVGFGLFVTHRHRWWQGVWWQGMEASSTGRLAAGRNWRRWARWQPAWLDTWWGQRSITTRNYRTKRHKSIQDIMASLPFLNWGLQGAAFNIRCGVACYTDRSLLSFIFILYSWLSRAPNHWSADFEAAPSLSYISSQLEHEYSMYSISYVCIMQNAFPHAIFT